MIDELESSDPRRADLAEVQKAADSAARLTMSGYTDDAVLQHEVLDSSTPFLPKPFSPEVLARKVREVLDSGAVMPR